MARAKLRAQIDKLLLTMDRSNHSSTRAVSNHLLDVMFEDEKSLRDEALVDALVAEARSLRDEAELARRALQNMQPVRSGNVRRRSRR